MFKKIGIIFTFLMVISYFAGRNAHAFETNMPVECEDKANVEFAIKDFQKHFHGNDVTRSKANNEVAVYINRNLRKFVVTIANNEFMCIISSGDLEEQEVIEYRM